MAVGVTVGAGVTAAVGAGADGAGARSPNAPPQAMATSANMTIAAHPVFHAMR